jgi:dTDP-glucose pyrophosphorylase
MAKLNGLILAGAFSEEDELVDRLYGRSRYAMPLANRALVRYAAEALVACGITDMTVAVSPATIADVFEMIGEGGASGARFHYLEQPDASTCWTRSGPREPGSASA